MRLGALPSLVRLLGAKAPEVAASAASALGALATAATHRRAIAASRGVAMLLACQSISQVWGACIGWQRKKRETPWRLWCG